MERHTGRRIGSARALVEEFPWAGYLPTTDAREFAAEFARAMLAAAELSHWEVLEQTVRDWKITAAAHASHPPTPGYA